MVSFSQGLIEKGLEKGLEKGICIGKESLWKQILPNLIVDAGNSFESAAALACVPEEKKNELKEELIREHLIPMDA